jgi:alpha-mannosidase
MKQVEVLETGPVRAVVRFYGKIQKSSFIQDVIVYQQLERIDFRHTLDYKSSMHTQTRVAYPLQVPEATVTYESPYSAVRLEKDEMPGTFRGHGERWVQKWIDLSNKNFGITLATRQISHAISPEGIEPILVRTSQCCGTIFYHFDQAHQYTFEYSLMAHAKDWRNANAHRHGWEFNSRLASTTMTTCFPIKPIRKSRQLPERDQFWWVNHNNVVITSISPSQANDAILIRLVEYFGKANTVMLKSKSIIDSVELVNFLEEHISDLTTDGKSIKLPVDKYGIYTLKVRLKK